MKLSIFIALTSAALAIGAHASEVATAGVAAPARTVGSSTEEANAARFSEHAKRVRAMDAAHTPQDELVLLSAEFMQDALGNQEFGTKQRGQLAKRITAMLCEGADEGKCRSASDHIKRITQLYGPETIDHADTTRAIQGLMSAVVQWLDDHSKPVAK